MARPSRHRRRHPIMKSLLGMSVSLMGIGAALLLATAALGSGGMLTETASIFETPAMLATGSGALLLVTHCLIRRRKTDEQTLAAADEAPTPQDQYDVPGDTTPSTTSMNTWGANVFAAIEWRRFEAVCEALFAQAGFETEVQPHHADGGVDIWMYSKNAQGPAAVVRCKHWQGKRVGLREMHEFSGLLTSHGLQRGTYASTSTYTREARDFAQANGINTMDVSSLLALIATRTPDQQAALLAIAYEGKYWRPTCPNCRIKLEEREPASNGALFWGCPNHPRCKTRIYMVSV